MLALIFGGLLAAVAAPIAFGALSGADGSEDLPEEDDVADEPIVDLPGEAPAAVYDITSGSSNLYLDDFRIGFDQCRLFLDKLDVEYSIKNSSDGVLLNLNTGEDTVSITFSGLEDVPFDDILLLANDPEMGQIEAPLSQLVAEEDPYPLIVQDAFTPPEQEAALPAVESVDMGAIDPIDPDTPDILPEPDPTLGDPIVPLDPDATETFPSDHIDATPLDPVVDPVTWGDADPGPGDTSISESESPVLQPDTGNDEIGLDFYPTQTELEPGVSDELPPGWSASAVQLLYPGDPVAVLENFQPWKDVLAISIEGDPNTPPELAVELAQNGLDNLVTLDGHPLAILSGSTQSDQDNVVLLVRSPGSD